MKPAASIRNMDPTILAYKVLQIDHLFGVKKSQYTTIDEGCCVLWVSCCRNRLHFLNLSLCLVHKSLIVSLFGVRWRSDWITNKPQSRRHNYQDRGFSNRPIYAPPWSPIRESNLMLGWCFKQVRVLIEFTRFILHSKMFRNSISKYKTTCIEWETYQPLLKNSICLETYLWHMGLCSSNAYCTRPSCTIHLK